MKEIHNKEIPRPVDLQGGKMDLVFNNIKDIYEWHREYVFMQNLALKIVAYSFLAFFFCSKFQRALRHCQKSPTDLGPLIKNSANKFTMYYYFCSNKPLSEFIVSEHQQYFYLIGQKLNHRLDVSNTC